MGPGFALACDVPAGWRDLVPEKPVVVTASLHFDQARIVIGQPFTVSFAICSETGEAVRSIEVDAVMPLHKHGMNYRPTLTRTGPFRYDASNMVFHMPGDWRIQVLTHQGGSVHAFSFDLAVK
jgi:hypothetical protein